MATRRAWSKTVNIVGIDRFVRVFGGAQLHGFHGRFDLVVFQFQQPLQRLPFVRLVLDHQDPRFAAAHLHALPVDAE